MSTTTVTVFGMSYDRHDEHYVKITVTGTSNQIGSFICQNFSYPKTISLETLVALILGDELVMYDGCGGVEAITQSGKLLVGKNDFDEFTDKDFTGGDPDDWFSSKVWLHKCCDIEVLDLGTHDLAAIEPMDFVLSRIDSVLSLIT